MSKPAGPASSFLAGVLVGGVALSVWLYRAQLGIADLGRVQDQLVAAFSPRATPAPTPGPRFVTTRVVQAKVPYGSVSIPSGTEFVPTRQFQNGVATKYYGLDVMLPYSAYQIQQMQPQLSPPPPVSLLRPDANKGEDVLLANPGNQTDFSKLAHRLIVIHGEKSIAVTGSGSGSIINIDRVPTLVTNIHVLSGLDRIDFHSVNSQPIQAGSLRVSRSHDLALISQSRITDGFEFETDLEKKVAIGDEVVLLGNSLGAGVVTDIKGKVIGIGPDLVEVDAKFVSGNSGCPILHKKSGKVIAIATFTEDVLRLGSSARDRDSQIVAIRRFGYRLDSAKNWEAVTWRKLTSEGRHLSEMQEHTERLKQIRKDITDDGYVSRNDYQSPGNVLRTFVTTFATFIDGPRAIAPQDILEAKRKFIRSLRFETERDWKPFSYEIKSYSSWHRNRIEEQIVRRKELYDFFDTVLNIQDTEKRIYLP